MTQQLDNNRPVPHTQGPGCWEAGLPWPNLPKMVSSLGISTFSGDWERLAGGKTDSEEVPSLAPPCMICTPLGGHRLPSMSLPDVSPPQGSRVGAVLSPSEAPRGGREQTL